MYCDKELMIPKNACARTSKCPKCRIKWQTLRSKYKQYGDGITVNILMNWWIRTPNECKECGSKKRMTIDRIIPEVKGGKYELSNIQKLCYKCNCCRKIAARSVEVGLRSTRKRKCLTCNKEKPLNKKYFHQTSFKSKYRKNTKGMYHPSCRDCRLKKIAKEWREKRLKEGIVLKKYNKRKPYKYKIIPSSVGLS